MGLEINRATWLDLERAQQTDPYVISLMLVDIPIHWDASPPDPNDPSDSGRGMMPGMLASRYFRLQLLETRGPNERAEWHFSREVGTEYANFDSFGLTWHRGMTPDRSGRLLYYRNRFPIFSDRRPTKMNYENENESALAVASVDGETSCVPLVHLRGRKIVRAVVDYYSGAVFLAYRTATGTSSPARTMPEGAIEAVVEYY